MSDFYDGFRMLQPVASFLSVPIDQVNYFVCMLTSMVLGRLLQSKYPAHNTPAVYRHVICFTGGCLLCFFCFGYQILHLLILSAICYAILRSHLMSLRTSRCIILIVALIYLSGCHILRQYLDYGGYTLDITGPVMILVQRVSTLAFNLYDGECLRKGQQLTNARHLRHALKEMPSLLQYMSYCINFQTVMVGPLLFYVDYSCYLEGRESDICTTKAEKERLAQMTSSGASNKQRIFSIYIFSAILHGCLFKLATPYFPTEYYFTQEFRSQSILYKTIYLLTTSSLLRQQYYFAWSLASLSCLCSDFGFSGFRSDGSASYDNIKNFDLLGIEFGSSFKIMTDSWNMPTTQWLRECVYDRLSRPLATPVTFLVSAFWHGFYPNYYTFFFTGALMTQAWRVGRRYVRPLVFPTTKEEDASQSVRLAYHTLTTLLSIYSLNYAAVPFVMLHFWKGVDFWREFYWLGHIASVLTILLLPKINFTGVKATRSKNSTLK